MKIFFIVSIIMLHGSILPNEVNKIKYLMAYASSISLLCTTYWLYSIMHTAQKAKSSESNDLLRSLSNIERNRETELQRNTPNPNKKIRQTSDTKSIASNRSQKKSNILPIIAATGGLTALACFGAYLYSKNSFPFSTKL